MSNEDDCPGCGATVADRQTKPDDNPVLRACPHCQSLKCCMCDMGDDVECISCNLDE